MKKINLLLAGLVLCTSQAVFAATQAEQAALDSAIASVSMNLNSQAFVNAAIQAAANADVSESDIVTQLYNLGVPANLISAAMSANVNLGANGGQPACSPSCTPGHTGNVSYASSGLNTTNTTLALLGSTGPTGAGGNQGGNQGGNAGGRGGLASLGGGFGTGGLTGGPNGAVSPH
ncbi:MAG: hypothetical protein NTY60_00920 [Proteobacteria bacterium]|nr:hypothetical protein [Pseudomonadota bacterium]